MSVACFAELAGFRRSQTAATTASDASPVVDRRYRASHTFGGHRPPLQRTSTQLRKSDTLRSVHNRLGRLDRIYVRAPIYFLTACTAQRRPLLAKQDVHEAFIRFAKQSPAHGVWIGAYVLMPDHLHAFVALDAQGVNLSALMKSLKECAVEEITRTRRRPATLAERIFRPLVAQSRIGWGEMEIRSGKSGAPGLWRIRTSGHISAKFLRWTIAWSVCDVRTGVL